MNNIQVLSHTFIRYILLIGFRAEILLDNTEFFIYLYIEE